MPDGRPRRPGRLRVEHLHSPFGLGTAAPRFSWWLPAGARAQLGYRIRAGNGWDTGRVESSGSILVDYTGPRLRSADRVSWQVKVWTDLGESDWSDPDTFELGLLEGGDWSAQWIAPVESELAAAGRRPAMLLRGEFELPDVPVARARLYATAHGIYEAFVNGQRAGDAELTPGFTEYRDRLQVQTYDIAAWLAPGRTPHRRDRVRRLVPRPGRAAARPRPIGDPSSASSRRPSSSSPTVRGPSPEPGRDGAAPGRTSTPPI